MVYRATYMLPEKICGIGLVYFRLVPAVSSFPRSIFRKFNIEAF